MPRRSLAALILAGFLASQASGAGSMPEGVDPKTGFRMENFRAPTPDVLPGGKVVGIEEVREAVETGEPALIDVYADGVALDPIGGGWALAKPHETIPGATWLPRVGGGRLTAEEEAFFRRNLETLAGGDKAKGVMIFCLADCWHSWNAAKRAAEWGYDVAWYPLGTDGWTEEGGTLVPVEPVNFLGLPE